MGDLEVIANFLRVQSVKEKLKLDFKNDKFKAVL